MNRRGNARLGKKAATVTDTATFPFWGVHVDTMEIFAHDEHGRQVGKAEKVSSLQEAFDLCEARNYPGRAKEGKS
jgi:hypothetical protein